MKKVAKGFMLAEVLIVSTLLVGIMTFMYTQIRTISSGYSRTFNYNTVDGLYGAKLIHESLNSVSYLGGLKAVKINELSNKNYFNALVEELGVIKIIISNNGASIYDYLINNRSSISSPYVGIDTSYYEKMISFSLSIKNDGYSHIVVAYDDGTFCDYKY